MAHTASNTIPVITGLGNLLGAAGHATDVPFESLDSFLKTAIFGDTALSNPKILYGAVGKKITPSEAHFWKRVFGSHTPKWLRTPHHKITHANITQLISLIKKMGIPTFEARWNKAGGQSKYGPAANTTGLIGGIEQGAVDIKSGLEAIPGELITGITSDISSSIKKAGWHFVIGLAAVLVLIGAATHLLTGSPIPSPSAINPIFAIGSAGARAINNRGGQQSGSVTVGSNSVPTQSMEGVL